MTDSTMAAAGVLVDMAHWLRTAPLGAAPPVTPFLFVAHALFIARKLRDSDGGAAHAHRYPLASLATFLAINFGASFVVAWLFNEAITVFDDAYQMPLAALCWYLVFFSPLDIVYKATSWKPLKVMLAALEGVRNGRRVIYGVESEKRGVWIKKVTKGWLSAAGSLYVAQLLRFFQGHTGANEFVRASPVSRVTLASSLLYVFLPWLERQSWLQSVWPDVLRPVEEVVLANLDVLIILANVAFLVATVLDANIDPVSRLVRPVWQLLFGKGHAPLAHPPGSISDRAHEAAARAAVLTSSAAPASAAASATDEEGSPASPVAATPARRPVGRPRKTPKPSTSPSEVVVEVPSGRAQRHSARR